MTAKNSSVFVPLQPHRNIADCVDKLNEFRKQELSFNVLKLISAILKNELLTSKKAQCVSITI
jgi:hypothetical protein